MDLRLASRAYCMAPTWKRVVVILAGPGVNILIAFLLFWAGALQRATSTARWPSATSTPPCRRSSATTSVQTIEHGQPAAGVLRAGDRIVAVDGRPATVSATMAGDRLPSLRGIARGGLPRGAPRCSSQCAATGRDVTLSVYPRYDKELEPDAGRLRLRPRRRGRSAPLAAAGAVAERDVARHDADDQRLRSGADQLEDPPPGLEHRRDHRRRPRNGVAGAGYALVFLGFLSLILAVINLFPFLPLDGGHVLWALAEKVRGRRISLLAMYRFSSVGIIAARVPGDQRRQQRHQPSGGSAG